MDLEDRFFDNQALKQLCEDYQKIHVDYLKLINQFANYKSVNTESDEFIKHGFLRRMSILKRCLENIFQLCPPDALEKISQEKRLNLTINIQCFMLNVYGVIDNLAWIWVKETKFHYVSNNEVSFTNSKIKKSLSPRFQEYLNSKRYMCWRKNLESFRHALAHRIPLYIPPEVLTVREQANLQYLGRQQKQAFIAGDFDEAERLSSEMEKMGQFLPVFTHSFSEKTPSVIFHPQLLADWNTLLKLTEELFLTLKK